MTGTPKWLTDRRAKKKQTGHATSRWEGDVESHDSITKDVAFNRHSMNDGHHVSPSDNGLVQVGIDGIKVALAQGINEDMLKTTLSAAVRATVGLDMTQGNALDAEDDWEEMLKGGLQTALETQVIVFAVGGVSRTCTHQLVRSRKAAFHQQSQRAGYMGDAPEIRIPESVWMNPRARGAFLRATVEAHDAYKVLCEEDISYQDARYVLPEGTNNFILCEYTIREFLNVFAYRGCSMFSWEIVHTMREMRRVLLEAHPWLEPYIKISCEKTGPVLIPLYKHGALAEHQEQVEHHCTFQGWERVEGQCDFPWAKEEARTFKPAFHQIGKK